MGRKVVVCCDGTWNDPADRTNVFRTYDLLRGTLTPSDDEPLGDDRRVARGWTPDGEKMLLYYDTGVGTKKWRRGSGGVFGAGLGENVCQAYAFLAEHWQDGDELYLFGFSRGAFTVRSLSGLLGCAGLPTRFSQGAIDAAWDFYRTPPREREPRDQVLAVYEPKSLTVRFLGVYDTVGSLGVPVPQLGWLNGLIERALGGVIRFHDTALGRNVETACQALAIHERRGTFKPVVWSRAPGRVERPDGTVCPQQILQVWFAGSHGNVGGGYPQTDLSDIAFDWMMRRAVDQGLLLPEEALAAAVAGNAYGSRYDSDRSWLGRLTSGDTLATVRTLAGGSLLMLGPVARIVDLCANLLTVRPADRRIGGEIEADDGTLSVPVGERIHGSVLDRYRGEHLPDSVRRALAANVEVFRERAEQRRQLDGEQAIVNGVACPLLDIAPSGARIGGAAWLVPGAEVAFQRIGRCPCQARVVWRQGDRAGLQLIAKAEQPAPSTRVAEAA